MAACRRERKNFCVRRWRLEPAISHALLQAVAKNKLVKSEEAVAIAALALIPNQLTGDEGWSAVRTAVHGGRVLGALADLSPEQVAELWAPIEPAISLESLDEAFVQANGVRGAVNNAIRKLTRPPRPKASAPAVSRAPAPFGG